MTDTLQQYSEQECASRVLEGIGLARRMGILICSVEDVCTRAAHWNKSGGQSDTVVLIAASDLAERSMRKLQQRAGTVSVFLSAAEIGHAAGMHKLGALAIPSGHVAKHVRRWLHVWNTHRQIEVA